MSLINDALKRARQSQPAKLASAAGPALRPVDPVAKSPCGVEFLAGGFIAGVLLLAGMLLFMWAHGAVEVRARTMSMAPATQEAQASKPVHVAAVVAASAVAQPTPIVAAVPQPIPAVEAAKPVALIFKLQSVFYVPNHVSAVINGKTVRVGSVVNHARVMTIGQDSATVVTAAGETKLLELPND